MDFMELYYKTKIKLYHIKPYANKSSLGTYYESVLQFLHFSF